MGKGTFKGEGEWKRPSCSTEPQITSEIACLCPSCSHMQCARCLMIDYVFSAYETQATRRLFLLLLQLYITVAITVSFVFVLWNV